MVSARYSGAGDDVAPTILVSRMITSLKKNIKFI